MTNKEGSSLDEAFDTVCNVGCAPRLTVGLTADYTDDQPNKDIYINLLLYIYISRPGPGGQGICVKVEQHSPCVWTLFIDITIA